MSLGVMVGKFNFPHNSITAAIDYATEEVEKLIIFIKKSELTTMRPFSQEFRKILLGSAISDKSFDKISIITLTTDDVEKEILKVMELNNEKLTHFFASEKSEFLFKKDKNINKVLLEKEFIPQKRILIRKLIEGDYTALEKIFSPNLLNMFPIMAKASADVINNYESKTGVKVDWI